MENMRTMVIPDRRGPDLSNTGDNPCYICNRNIKLGAEKWGIHPIKGGNVALHPDDEPLYVSDGGDLGLHPIGSDCRKRMGEFAFPWK